MDTQSSDPRGPERTIVHVVPTSTVTLVTLSCGHVGEFNQIYSYRIGDVARCIRCAKQARKAEN